jgi:hypothetical protein
MESFANSVKVAPLSLHNVRKVDHDIFHGCFRSSGNQEVYVAYFNHGAKMAKELDLHLHSNAFGIVSESSGYHLIILQPEVRIYE